MRDPELRRRLSRRERTQVSSAVADAANTPAAIAERISLAEQMVAEFDQRLVALDERGSRLENIVDISPT